MYPSSSGSSSPSSTATFAMTSAGVTVSSNTAAGSRSAACSWMIRDASSWSRAASRWKNATPGASGGSWPRRMSRNLSRGTYFPSTSRHVVSGPDRMRPIGPHRNDQKAAATSWATSDMPRLVPNSQGSNTYPASNSKTMYSPATANGWAIESEKVNENSVGGISPTQVPM